MTRIGYADVKSHLESSKDNGLKASNTIVSKINLYASVQAVRPIALCVSNIALQNPESASVGALF